MAGAPAGQGLSGLADPVAWARVAAAVAARPALWPAAARQGRRLVAPGWWRRWPPQPVPVAWLRFRLITAYGGEGRAPEPDDVVGWLAWTAEFDRLERGARSGRARSAGTAPARG